MARKSSTTKKSIPMSSRSSSARSDMELSDDAIDLDFEFDASMDDLEAQISQAAEELAREGRSEK